MSSQTRRALKSLQYSPKGQGIAGLPPALNKRLETKLNVMKDLTPHKRILNAEEKENPSSALHQQLQGQKCDEVCFAKNAMLNSAAYQDVSVQCSKYDDDMMTMDEPPKEYWRLMVEKRKAALRAAINENKELHEEIVNLHQENEIMREENKELLELLKEVDSIKTSVMEQEGEDSGCPLDATQ